MTIYEAKKGDQFPLVLVDVTNDDEHPWDVSYASLTAPKVVRLDIKIDDEIVEIVFAGAGGSHSWWTAAGGKFFPPHKCHQGLHHGCRMQVIVDGPCALRIDWIE